MFRIETKNKEYSGVIAGVQITGGVGETDDPMAISYFERHEATITDLSPADGDPTEAEAEAEAVTPWPDGEPTEKWRTAELEAYAEAHGVDLTGAGNKAEKLEAIRAHAAN